MSWRVAGSLLQLRREVNLWRPLRDRSSDGCIGDADHQNRSSDHNPWVPDYTGRTNGVVTACDFDEDHDEKVGQVVLDATVGRRDRRVKYVIYEKKIYRSYDKPGIPAWTPATYTGSNAHASHIHVSVSSDPALFDRTDTWQVEPEEDDVPRYFIKLNPGHNDIYEVYANHLEKVANTEVFNRIKGKAEVDLNPPKGVRELPIWPTELPTSDAHDHPEYAKVEHPHKVTGQAL